MYYFFSGVQESKNCLLSKVYHWGTDLGDSAGTTFGFIPDMHLEAIFNLVECGFAVSLAEKIHMRLHLFINKYFKIKSLTFNYEGSGTVLDEKEISSYI